MSLKTIESDYTPKDFLEKVTFLVNLASWKQIQRSKAIRVSIPTNSH